MLRLCIIYNINKKNSIKYEKWTDGFTSAINILKSKYKIDMINSSNNNKINFNNYDIIFFKESFNGNMYKKYKNKIKNKIKGLFISSSNKIPTDNDLKLYHILFYETYWYYNYANLLRHKYSYHAFGVDTNIMKQKECVKKYDVIFVGNIISYKRPLNILKESGNKICLGFKTDNSLVSELTKNNVVVKDFIQYNDLANYYNSSKLCYVPCTIHGGGERSVLEARACGVPVKIEDDNLKLKELLESQIYSSVYYSNQIDFGIKTHYENNNNSYYK